VSGKAGEDSTREKIQEKEHLQDSIQVKSKGLPYLLRGRGKAQNAGDSSRSGQEI